MRLASQRAYLPEPNENNSLTKETCDLCRAEEKSFRYHDDDVCWAALNPSSGVPIVVLKKHRQVPAPEDQQHMLRVLDFIMEAHGFSNRGIDLGNTGGTYSYSDPTTIPDHYHIQGGKHEYQRQNRF